VTSMRILYVPCAFRSRALPPEPSKGKGRATSTASLTIKIGRIFGRFLTCSVGGPKTRRDGFHYSRGWSCIKRVRAHRAVRLTLPLLGSEMPRIPRIQ
jgi:hypothetical protein